MAFSPRIYDHWKLALLSYFVVNIFYSVLGILNPSFPSFTVRLVVEVAPLLAWIPGFLYIFSEFARLADGEDPSSKRLTKTFLIGFLTFFVFGVAIPHSYNIAFDAFQVTLPYSTQVRYLLNGGDLAGQLTLGAAAIYARRVEPIRSPEPEKRESKRVQTSEGLALLGLIMLMFGFTIGIGFLAFAAFLVIIVGAILLSIGLIVRWSIAGSES